MIDWALVTSDIVRASVFQVELAEPDVRQCVAAGKVWAI